MFERLDNPIWHALTTCQTNFAEGGNLARRFRPEITTLAGFPKSQAENFDALHRLMKPQELAALFLKSPPMPSANWYMLDDVPLLQMVDGGGCLGATQALAHAELNSHDTPEMRKLAELANPGPFGTRAYELGTFLGFWRDGQLVAMAGERLRLPQYVEITAVCTHPNHLGHGYASGLVIELMKRIRATGNSAFLHVRADNNRAIRLYKKLGFKERRTFRLIFLRPLH